MLSELQAWINDHQPMVEQIGNLSLIVLVITVIALPIAVKQLPVDYFISEKREPARATRKHSLIWTLLSLLKNLVGLVLILVGIIMVVLPGQGTVTILIGLAISNFPGKYKLERRIACQPAVGKTLNKIRKLTGATPLAFPTER
ncbi:MAG: PGPGW domain-containing protein [Thermodesulfobacteriota bacterium]